MKKGSALRFRNVPVGAMFEFPYYADSKFRGTYKKISARKFTDGYKEYKCAVSAAIAKIER